jgi:ATP-dependent Clp protease ATP-binding subunit ClpC
VFDLLLQVLGEARLTDGRGHTTYFHNSIIVLTSNLGTRSAKGHLGLGPAEDEDARPEMERGGLRPARGEERRYRDAVIGAFRPELVNRLDQIVVFHPLRADEIATIADIAIARLAERRGLTQAGVLLDVSPAATARLAEGGFSPELGARALRRHLDAALVAPAARLLAKAGVEGHGGTLTVRAPDETIARASGSRIGEHAGDVHVALWRRAAATGRRMVRSALALGELRRDTERELALPGAQAVVAKLSELEATLATAARRSPASDGKSGLPGAELARLSTEHARLSQILGACRAHRGELCTAEELCLEALAKDIDAVDLIDGAIAQRDRFRRDLFWLLTALRLRKPGATLLVHTPDARAATVAWLKLVLGAAAHHGWGAAAHLWNEQGPGWHHPWGPPRDAEYIEKHPPAAALVRISGAGADSLIGLEAGLHRFVGLAGEPCHVWVDALEPKTEFSAIEWTKLPGPPTPKPPRGAPLREITIPNDRVVVGEDEIAAPWSELAARLEEAAVVRVLTATKDDPLWHWQHPLQEPAT